MLISSSSSVTFVDVRKRFDFRSIAIGRWVSNAERDRSAGQFYDALNALMQALKCPELVISLRGSLSFQYGIGGRPGVAAHYDPRSRCFSLAKNAGPGSIAHEWFHALDHYLAHKVFSDARSGMFASTAWLSEATPIPHSLNDQLYRCFNAIALSDDGSRASDMFRASAQMDRKLAVQYYAKPEELCARAFEAYIDDRVKNAFLVGDTRHSEEAKHGLFPKALQREQINSAFDDYFSSLGQALARK